MDLTNEFFGPCKMDLAIPDQKYRHTGLSTPDHFIFFCTRQILRTLTDFVSCTSGTKTRCPYYPGALMGGDER